VHTKHGAIVSPRNHHSDPNHIKEWQWEDLCGMLDEQVLGFIDFNEVNKWLNFYDIKFGIPIMQKDSGDYFEDKLNITPQQYKLTDNDYFRTNCKTILNSEIAALKVAEELF
jgi:hypothetical protein